MFSTSERNLWAELLIDCLVLVYFVPKAWRVFQYADVHTGFGPMGKLVGSTIIFAIVAGIAVTIIFTILFKDQGHEALDERELSFKLRSYRFAYYVLIVCIFLLLGQIALESFFPGYDTGFSMTENPTLMVTYLFISLSLASIFQCSSQLFYYRRGY